MASSSRSRRRTQAERREIAEQRLLEAALEIVARRGAVRMTLAEVGTAAGYSRGLPAQRFGSKAGLLRALAASIGTRFAERLAAAPPRQPGLDALYGKIAVYFDRSDGNWMTTRALLAMLTEGFMEDSELRELITRYNRDQLASFEADIRTGIENGEIAAGTDPTAMAVLLLGALRGATLQWLLDPSIDLPGVRDLMPRLVTAVLPVGQTAPGGEAGPVDETGSGGEARRGRETRSGSDGA
ncbi:MAG: TetR family transcriptional regulator C-terminal domain-containing protein [Burkholderiaceae bacterium]